MVKAEIKIHHLPEKPSSRKFLFFIFVYLFETKNPQEPSTIMSGASEDSGDEHDSPTEFGYAQLGDGEDAGEGAGEDNNEENQDDEEQVNENSSQQAETVDVSGTANGAADSDVQAKPLPPHLDALLDEKEKNSVKKVVKNHESQEEAKKIEEAKKQFEQNYQKEMYSNLPKTQPIELSAGM